MKKFFFNNIITPCYIIDKDIFEQNISNFKNSFKNDWGENILFGYSIKTNHVQYLMEFAKQIGMYAEAVSGDEYKLALNIGYDAREIIFNGPQKNEEDLLYALTNGSIVNIDNESEIDIIEKKIHLLKKEDLRLGLRINFDLESDCPNETTSGTEVSRFGICLENGDFERCINRIKRLGIKVSGLHLHYSSKSRSLNIFKALSEKAVEVIEKYGLKNDISYIDVGGGFFGGMQVKGKPEIYEYSKVICKSLKKILEPKDVLLILEPGASTIATSTKYISKVINIRDIRNTRIVTIDGSNLHINPLMAQREPSYLVMNKRNNRIKKQILCGCTCMENDRLLSLENEYSLDIDDYIIINNVGAYTMAFNSCFINLPPNIYVIENGGYKLVRSNEINIMLKI